MSRAKVSCFVRCDFPRYVRRILMDVHTGERATSLGLFLPVWSEGEQERMRCDKGASILADL